MNDNKLKPLSYTVKSSTPLSAEYLITLSSFAAKDGAIIYFEKLLNHSLPVIEVHIKYDNGKTYLDYARVFKTTTKTFSK